MRRRFSDGQPACCICPLPRDSASQKQTTEVLVIACREAATALSLNGLQLADREIRVSMAKQSLTNSASAVMPSMLGYPNLVNPYAAMMPSFGMPMARQRPAQDAEKVSRTIHIDNLDFGISEYHLAQYFGVCGNVSAVRIAGNPGARRKAWVEFHDPMSVQSAFQLDNQVT